MTLTTMRKKRRKMKQMQGLLLLARLQHPVAGAATNSTSSYSGGSKALFGAAKKVLVVLQPQQLQLAYSAQVTPCMWILGREDGRTDIDWCERASGWLTVYILEIHAVFVGRPRYDAHPGTD